MDFVRYAESSAALLNAELTDRDAVVARLQAAMGEGRIDMDEFGQRASAAYAAVTTAELCGVMPRSRTKLRSILTSLIGSVVR